MSTKALCFLAICLPCSFVHLSGQILLPRYLMNGWSNLDEMYRVYSLVPTDDRLDFGGQRSQQAIHVGTAVSKYIF